MNSAHQQLPQSPRCVIVGLIFSLFLTSCGEKVKNRPIDQSKTQEPWATIARSTADTVDFQLAAPAFTRIDRTLRFYAWFLVQAAKATDEGGKDSASLHWARAKTADNLVSALDFAPEATRSFIQALLRAIHSGGGSWQEYRELAQALPPQPVEFEFEPSTAGVGIGPASVWVRDDLAQDWIENGKKAFNAQDCALQAYQTLYYNADAESNFRRATLPLIPAGKRLRLIVNTPPNLPGFTPCDILPLGLSLAQRQHLSPESVARFTAIQSLTGVLGASVEGANVHDSLEAAFISNLRLALIGLRYACRSETLVKIGLPETGLSQETAVGVFLSRSLAAICREKQSLDPEAVLLAMLLREGLVGESQSGDTTLFAFDGEKVLAKLDYCSDHLTDTELLGDLRSITQPNVRELARAKLPTLERRFSEMKPREVIWHYPRLKAVRNKMGGLEEVEIENFNFAVNYTRRHK